MIGCAVWILWAISLPIIMLGLVLGSVGVVFFGFLFFGAGVGLLVYAIRPGGVLHKDEVVDSWSAHIDCAEGRAEEIFNTVLEQIQETKAPNVAASRTRMSPTIERGFMNVYREFVVVRHSGNHRLNPYQLYVNARDYGTNLVVDWHLTYRPTLPKLIMLILLRFTRNATPLDELDLFDMQDLRAYATTAHRCVLNTVRAVMTELNQDPAKVEDRSKGFLGIS